MDCFVAMLLAMTTQSIVLAARLRPSFANTTRKKPNLIPS
jgi:hypothetical protein